MCKLKKFLSVFLSLSLVTSASVQQNAFAATPNDGKCWEQKFNEVDKGSNSIFMWTTC